MQKNKAATRYYKCDFEHRGQSSAPSKKIRKVVAGIIKPSVRDRKTEQHFIGFGISLAKPPHTTRKKVSDNVSELSKRYFFRNPKEIIAYLTQYPELVPILKKAPNQIKEVFQDEKLILEVASDLEHPSWKKMFVYIISKSDLQQDMDKLEKLYEDWWLDTSIRESIGNKLSIDIDFENDSV